MRAVPSLAERIAVLERRQRERRAYVTRVEALIERREVEIDRLKEHL